MTFDNLLGYILSISMRMQNFIKIFQTVSELSTFFTNRPASKSSQTRRRQNFHKLSGEKIKCLIIGHSKKFNFKSQLTFLGSCNWRLTYDPEDKEKSRRCWLSLTGKHYSMGIADKFDVMYNKPVTDRAVNFAQQLLKRISFQVNGLKDCCYMYVPLGKDGCTSSKLVPASKLVLASILVLHSL